MKYLALFENYKKLILKPGDLASRLDKFGESDELINDLYLYMQEDHARSTKTRLATRWNGVETVNPENFEIYRGISLTPESHRYQGFDSLLGDSSETSRYPITLAKETIKISFGDYSSWSRSHNIAKSYAQARPGDIKVILAARVHDVKVLANLFEIGDESDEVLVYPFRDLEVRFKAWRESSALLETANPVEVLTDRLADLYTNIRELDELIRLGLVDAKSKDLLFGLIYSTRTVFDYIRNGSIGDLNIDYAIDGLVLPDGMVVNGTLWASNSKFTRLPNNLTITKNLYIRYSNISDIPHGLKVGGDIFIKSSVLSEKYTVSELKSIIHSRGGHVAGFIIGD